MKGDKNNEVAKVRSFRRIMKALSPLAYLSKAHDYYVKSLNKWAAKGNYSGLATASFSSATSLPKSFSTTSARKDEEYGELVRAASQKRYSSSKLGFQRSMASAELALARSRSAAPSVGTIHEDEPCYFPAFLPKTASAAASTCNNLHPQ